METDPTLSTFTVEVWVKAPGQGHSQKKRPPRLKAGYFRNALARGLYLAQIQMQRFLLKKSLSYPDQLSTLWVSQYKEIIP